MAILKPSCWNRLVLPFALALLGLCLNLIVAVNMAPTTDEDGHISYGAAILRGSADRSYWWYDSKMPISVFNAIPRVVIRKVLEACGVDPKLTNMLQSVRVARCATLIAAFCLCLLVYFYAESLFGRVAGLFTQLLFVLSPNIIAHSALATTDLYAALAFVLFLYCLRRFILVPSPANSALAGAALALVQLVKFVGVYLYATLVLVLVSVALYRKFGRQDLSRIPGSQILVLLAFHAVFFLAFVNAGFLFDRTLTPLGQYEFRSTTFQQIQRIPWVREVPLPVPYPYIQGFDWMSYHNETRLSFGNIVLLDEVRGREQKRSDGFASYYLVCYALKEPLGMQIFLLLGIIWLVRHRPFGDFLSGEFPLIVTAVVLIAMLSLFNNAQIGIRHILPALVAFVILSGGAFTGWAHSSRRRKVLLGVCLLYVAISVGSYFPHMIPYFNEIVGDRKMAYRFLADSNLDWRQDQWIVAAFLKNNPDVKLAPKEPVVGRVLVRANLVAGVFPAKGDYWVRQRRLKPIAHVGYAHLLFSVPMEVAIGPEARIDPIAER